MSEIMNYKDVLEDWKYLFEEIGQACDMTGAYEEEYDLVELFKTPTKKKAAELMVKQIQYWFKKGPEINGICLGANERNLERLLEENSKVAELKDKYC